MTDRTITGGSLSSRYTVQQKTLFAEAAGAPFGAHTKTLVRGSGWYDRDYYSLAIVRGGGGDVITSPSWGEPRSAPFLPGVLLLFRPGEATYLRPSRPHEFTISFVSSPSAIWRDFARLTGLNPGWEPTAEPLRAVIRRDESALVKSFDSATRHFGDEPTVFHLVEFLSMAMPYFADSGGFGTGTEHHSAPEWLVHSMEAMCDEGNLRAGVPRFIELAHVSSGYLALMTRRHYGRTPVAIVTGIRLQFAAHLLQTSSAAIGSIAQRCGFRSLAYFSNRFREEFHVSPRAYRSRPA